MEGPYGTGKTLLAFKLAKDAIDNGWVFMYLKTPEMLAQTLRLAKSIDKNGLIGLFMGGFTACAVGVSAALIFSYLASLIFKPKMKG